MSDSNEKLVAEMIRHEHQRWNQWAVGFVGAVVTIFVVWDKVSDEIPVWIACCAASVVSILWIFASLGIRKSTWSWWTVANHIGGASKDTDIDLFAVFTKTGKEFSWTDDFVQCMIPWRKNSLGNTTVVSVTATIVRASVLATVLLMCLTFYYFLPWATELWVAK